LSCCRGDGTGRNFEEDSMEGKGRYLITGAAVIALLMGAFFLGRAVGAKEGVVQDQVEAVKSGHAKYVIVDEFGRTEFRWYDRGDVELKKEEAKKVEEPKKDKP
jgi:hypothetical protein